MVAHDALAHIRVLVVDNDIRLLDLEKEILSTFGFSRIDVAHNGVEALSKMQNESYDIILCDWEMSPMRGIDFVRHVRQDIHSPNPFVPIIMITGRAEQADVEEARDAGITEFVAKPFTIDDLRQRIIAVVEKPRPFILAEEYKGPDRRRHDLPAPEGIERREQKDLAKAYRKKE